MLEGGEAPLLGIGGIHPPTGFTAPTPALCSSTLVADAGGPLTCRCEEVGVDAFELNMSCPHGMPERKMGMAMGQDCDLLSEVRGPGRGGGG